MFTKGNQTTDDVCKDGREGGREGEGYLNQISADRVDTVCLSSKTAVAKAIGHRRCQGSA